MFVLTEIISTGSKSLMGQLFTQGKKLFIFAIVYIQMSNIFALK